MFEVDNWLGRRVIPFLLRSTDKMFAEKCTTGSEELEELVSRSSAAMIDVLIAFPLTVTVATARRSQP